MKKERQRVIWGFEPFDYRASEAYIESMAKRGKKLESVSGYIASFTPCEPGEWVCRIGIFAEELSDGGQKKRQTWLNRWTKAGWEFCAQSDYLYYFCREGTDRTLPPGFRQQEELLLRVAIWRREFYAVFVTLLILAFSLINQTRMTYRSLLTYTDFCKTSLFCVFALPGALILLYHLIFFLRRRSMIRRGEALPVPSLAAARTRTILIYSITVLFLLYVICSFAADALSGYPRVILSLLPLLLAVGVVFLVRRLRARGKKRTLLTGILVIFTVSIGLAFLSVANLDNASGELPEGRFALHVTDLDPADRMQRASYVHTQSPLVPEHYVYVETGENGTRASTEYIRCVGAKSTDLMYELVMKALADVEEGSYSLQRTGNEILYCEPAIAEPGK